MKKPPKIAQWALLRINRKKNRDTILGDFEEFYNEIYQESGPLKAVLWYWYQLLKSIPRFITTTIYWRTVMFKNYLKVTLRNMLRHKGYSVINISGLAMGLTCCIFILLYIQFELSYDTYHPDADRIYRIALEQQQKTGTRSYATVSQMIAPALRTNFSKIELAGRILGVGIKPVKYVDRMFYEEKIAHVDPDIFNIFSVPFIRGNPATALKRPGTAVLTQQMAEKYFGNEDPVGKFIEVDTASYEITGIIQNPPENTHLKFSMVMSYKSIEHVRMLQAWDPGIHPAYTYIKFKERVNVEAFEEQITQYTNNQMKEKLEQRGYIHTYFLQSLTGIHLHSHLSYETEPPGNLLYIYVFSAIGIFILLIACMNFMNLSTARSANRSGEVGMRKVVGAQRKQLVWQFLGEALVLSFISLLLALVIVCSFLQFFNNIIDIQFTGSNLLNPRTILLLFGLMFFIGIIAGSYPAFILSAFKPISVLQGTLRAGSSGALLRKCLVVVQFAISITLITGTIIVYNQLNYMKNTDLGFDKEQKLIVDLPRFSMIRDNYEFVKGEFLQHPSVTGAAASSSIPGRRMFYWRIFPTGEEGNSQGMNFINADYDFIPEYGLELVAGRSFQRDMRTDAAGNGRILNEAAAHAFGWTPAEALTKFIGPERGPIIGVIKDFHFKGLQSTIEPLVLSIWSDHFKCITLNVNTENLRETLSFIEKKYKELFPGYIFEYFFLDTDFNRQYNFEEQLGRIFGIFTFLGLLIACLGLFGLSSFIAEQRTKEIGIRRVLGASVSGIIGLLTKEFVKWVGVGIIIAWPAAYYVMYRWLEGFAYRIKPGISSFLISGSIALLIAVLTVIYQAYKAAAANPVNALKYE